MNSKDYKNLSEAYEHVYLKEETVEFCNEFIFETEEESQYFVNSLFEDEELAVEFFDDVAEYIQDNQLQEDTYITEIRSALIKRGLKVAGGLLKKASPALKGANPKTLLKKGIKPATLSKAGKPLKGAALDTAVKGNAISTGVRDARKAAQAGIPSERPGKYLDMLNQKRVAKALPPAGGTSAGTFKATAERGLARDKAARQGLSNVLDTFTKGLQGFIKRGSAQDKLARAARGTKGTGVRVGQPGVRSTTMGKVQAPKPAQAPVPEFPVSKPITMGKVQAPKPAQAPKPEWERVRSTTMGKPQTPQQPAAPAPQWGGSKQAQDIKRFNQLNRGGVIGGTATKKTPRPAFGPGSGPSPVDPAVDRAFKGGPLAKQDLGVKKVTVSDVTPKTSRATAAQAKLDAAAKGTKGTGVTSMGGKEVKALPPAGSKAAAAQAKLDAAAKGTKGVGPATPLGAGGGALVAKGSSGSSRVASANAKLASAAKGTKGVGPATPLGAGGGALVAKGSSGSSRVASANAKLASAAKGTTGSGVKTGTTSAITKAATQTGKKGFKGKGVLAGLAVGAGLGLLSRDSAPKSPTILSDRETTEPKPPSAPGPKPPSAPGPKPPSAPGPKPTKPKGETKPPITPSGPRPMTKIDTDVMDLMNMRARSLDRQGRTKDAEELRSKIEKKYGGRKPYK